MAAVIAQVVDGALQVRRIPKFDGRPTRKWAEILRPLADSFVRQSPPLDQDVVRLKKWLWLSVLPQLVENQELFEAKNRWDRGGEAVMRGRS
jgi:hypothetical protein